MSAKNSKSRRRTRAASNKKPDTPANLMDDWVINRRLNKLEQGYRNDQKNRPKEILSSSIGGPGAEAIHYTVERLKQLVEEIKNVFEAEIEAGRVADTAHLWATVYSQKILPSIKPKINSLADNLARKLWVTGGGDPGERAAVEEAQRELSRISASLDRELISAREQVPKLEHRYCRLSEFDAFAGHRYLDALIRSTSRRVSRETLARIAEQLDNSPFAEPLDHLERSHRTQLAAHNSKHSREAIKSWTRLCLSSKFRSFARKALNRAAEKCRECC